MNKETKQRTEDRKTWACYVMDTSSSSLKFVPQASSSRGPSVTWANEVSFWFKQSIFYTGKQKIPNSDSYLNMYKVTYSQKESEEKTSYILHPDIHLAIKNFL